MLLWCSLIYHVCNLLLPYFCVGAFKWNWLRFGVCVDLSAVPNGQLPSTILSLHVQRASYSNSLLEDSISILSLVPWIYSYTRHAFTTHTRYDLSRIYLGYYFWLPWCFDQFRPGSGNVAWTYQSWNRSGQQLINRSRSEGKTEGASRPCMQYSAL